MNLQNLRRLEPLAPADRRDDEVQGGVLGVAAFFDEVLRRLVRDANLDELLIVRVVLAKVGAEATLSVMYLKHVPCSFRSDARGAVKQRGGQRPLKSDLRCNVRTGGGGDEIRPATS